MHDQHRQPFQQCNLYSFSHKHWVAGDHTASIVWWVSACTPDGPPRLCSAVDGLQCDTAVEEMQASLEIAVVTCHRTTSCYNDTPCYVTLVLVVLVRRLSVCLWFPTVLSPVIWITDVCRSTGTQHVYGDRCFATAGPRMWNFFCRLNCKVVTLLDNLSGVSRHFYSGRGTTALCGAL